MAVLGIAPREMDSPKSHRADPHSRLRELRSGNRGNGRWPDDAAEIVDPGIKPTEAQFPP